jgi:predicted nucleic acid-binding protein
VRVLIDTSVLVEAERRAFDLGAWVERQDAEIYICDAGVAEFLAGEPLKDEGKRKRFHQFWESFVSHLPSLPLDRKVCERAGALLVRARRNQRVVPLGDGLHGAVAELEGLEVWTIDTAHFADMAIPANNPLAQSRV